MFRTLASTLLIVLITFPAFAQLPALSSYQMENLDARAKPDTTITGVYVANQGCMDIATWTETGFGQVPETNVSFTEVRHPWTHHMAYIERNNGVLTQVYCHNDAPPTGCWIGVSAPVAGQPRMLYGSTTCQQFLVLKKLFIENRLPGLSANSEDRG